MAINLPVPLIILALIILAIIVQLLYSYLDFRENEKMLKERKEYGKKEKKYTRDKNFTLLDDLEDLETPKYSNLNIHTGDDWDTDNEIKTNLNTNINKLPRKYKISKGRKRIMKTLKRKRGKRDE